MTPEQIKEVTQDLRSEENQYPNFDGPKDVAPYIDPEVAKPRKKKKRNKKRLPQSSVDMMINKTQPVAGADRKYSDSEIMDAIDENGGNIRKTSIELGYNYRYLRKIIKTNKDIEITVENAREDHKEEIMDLIEDRLERMAREGNFKAMVLYLKAHGADRGYVEKRQLQSDPDRPLRIEIRRSSPKLLPEAI